MAGLMSFGAVPVQDDGWQPNTGQQETIDIRPDSYFFALNADS